jgi:hypothetical protein
MDQSRVPPSSRFRSRTFLDAVIGRFGRGADGAQPDFVDIDSDTKEASHLELHSSRLHVILGTQVNPAGARCCRPGRDVSAKTGSVKEKTVHSRSPAVNGVRKQ